MRNELFAASLHLLECRQATRVIGLEEKFCLTVIVCSPQVTVHGRFDVSQALFFAAAMPVAITNVHPFFVPAFKISGNHAAGGLEHLTDRTSTLLGFAQTAAELIRQPRVLWPVVPAVGLVMR